MHDTHTPPQLPPQRITSARTHAAYLRARGMRCFLVSDKVVTRVMLARKRDERDQENSDVSFWGTAMDIYKEGGMRSFWDGYIYLFLF